jgi:hypothetical protein
MGEKKMSKLEHEHNDAIRAEVGERLGILRKPEKKLPTRFRHLIDRLAKLDYKIEKEKKLPPIVPSGEEGWLRRLLAGRLRLP